MAPQITSTASPQWARLFTAFTRSAFRLEGLQHYAEPGEAEAFARFCAGQVPQVDLSWWLGLARGHICAGRSMSRVRIIEEPPTDYTRFELACYPAMVEAGDDIRIIAGPPGTVRHGLPPHDFWLFDDRDVWVLTYDPDGVFRYAELLDDPRVVADHLRWRDLALAQSISVHDYLVAAEGRAS
jgi:Family of unknown function (DUF6879)